MNELSSHNPLTWHPGCDIIDGVREVPLSVLGNGQRFYLVLQLPDGNKKIPGRVIYRTAGSVLVEVEGKGTHSFTTAEGETITFGAGMQRQHWSLNAPVLVRGPESDDEGDEMATQTAERTVALPGVPAKKAAAPKAAAAAVKTPKAPKQLNPCGCGCGDKVAGRFRQGHDSRYYSLLKKVVRKELEFNKLPKLMQQTVGTAANAAKLVAAHGGGAAH